MARISDISNSNIIRDKFLEENKIIFKKYKPIGKIDKGAFGNIYSVYSLKDGKNYAMKTEKINAEQKTLESEAFYLKILQGGKGIPEYITFGHTKNYNILIETLLGLSLYNIFIKKKKRCHIIDVCKIGCQILNRIEWIHSKNLIYRDIKPENFLIDKKDQDIIYVVDFGLCKRYISLKTGKHISEKITGKFNGTLIYSSPNVVKGIESSRRDDLISLGYMLIYLYKRSLPWESNFQNLNREKYYQLIKLKETNGFNKLFKNIPGELAEYINYSRKLKFEEKPNYDYLRSLFTKIISKNQIHNKTIPNLANTRKSISTKKNDMKNKELQLQDKKEEINNKYKTLNYKLKGSETNYKLHKNVPNNIPQNILNINNIYLKKIIYNNNNNVNLNANINSEQIFLNKNSLNSLNNNNNISPRINFNKNNINQKSEIITFKPFDNVFLNHNEYRRKFKPIITNGLGKVTSESINFKKIYLNRINNNNFTDFNVDENNHNILRNQYINKVLNNKINYTTPAKDKKDYSISNNNLHYKSPLLQNLHLYNYIINDIKTNTKKKRNNFQKQEFKSNYNKTNISSISERKIGLQKNKMNFNKVKDDYIDGFTRKTNYIPKFQVNNKSKMNNAYENFI